MLAAGVKVGVIAHFNGEQHFHLLPWVEEVICQLTGIPVFQVIVKHFGNAVADRTGFDFAQSHKIVNRRLGKDFPGHVKVIEKAMF